MYYAFNWFLFAFLDDDINNRATVNLSFKPVSFPPIEIDCGVLPTPVMATKVLETGTKVDGVVRYACKEKGYEISGSEMRTCLSTGVWSGFTTSCKSKCLIPFKYTEKDISCSCSCLSSEYYSITGGNNLLADTDNDSPFLFHCNIRSLRALT